MKGNFKSLFRRFCLEGSVLGLKYFYLYPDRLTRCFWSLVMSLTLYQACLLTWLLYRRFEEMPTRISIENQYESILNFPHPAITICSPNQLTISSMKHFNRTLIDGQRSVDLEKIIPQLLGFSQLIDDLDVEGLDSLQNLIDLNRYTAIEVMGSMSQSCDQFMKRCYFRNDLIPCGQIFKPILTRHGVCCIFNSIYHFKHNKRNERIKHFEPYLVTRTGLIQSLTVVVDYDPEDAIDRTVVYAGSTRIMVTDWTEFPADDESRMVPPNTESFHMLHATYTYCSYDVQSLPTQSRKCYFEDEQKLQYFRGYHNSDCDLLCFVKEVEMQCHCTMIYTPNLRVNDACNVTSIPCIIEAKMMASQTLHIATASSIVQMSKWYKTEQCNCPRDCVSRRYKLELTVGNLDALPYLTTNPYTNLTFTKSTSILHIFFPTPVYVIQKQETVMSLISLASNLGGVFGLCLGCSVISVFEVLFYLYMVIKNNLQKQLRNALLNNLDYCN